MGLIGIGLLAMTAWPERHTPLRFFPGGGSSVQCHVQTMSGEWQELDARCHGRPIAATLRFSGPDAPRLLISPDPRAGELHAYRDASISVILGRFAE